MADTSNTLSAEVRSRFGKGAARKIRAAGKIPAVIYGHGTEPQHVTLPGHETMLLVRKANTVLELDIEGHTELALVKDVQRDPVRQVIEHVDLIVVRRGETVQVDIPLHIEGETAPGTFVNLDLNSLPVDAEATHIPESIVVDVEGLEEGSQVHAKDVRLPQGVVLSADHDALILSVVASNASSGDSEDSGAGDDTAAE